MATRFTPDIFEGQRDARQFGRQPILLPARLITTIGEAPVRLIDISAGGARISGAELPEPGTDVVLKRDGFETFGIIVWTANGQAGMQFDEPIDAAAFRVAHGLPAVTADRAPASGSFGRKTSGHPRLSTGAGWIER